MCAPVLAVAAIAVTAASTVYAASAAQASANAQAQQVIYTAQNEAAVADYNADVTENVTDYNVAVAEQNAQVYDQAADDAVERGAQAAADERDFSRRSSARGRAVAASSGTVVDVGTNLQLQLDNVLIGEMNALTAMNNGAREAYGYSLDATAERNRAKGIRYTGDMEAESIRLTGQVGLANARYAASNIQYGGKLEAMGTYLSGAASILQMGYKTDIFAGNASRGGDLPWRAGVQSGRLRANPYTPLSFYN